MTKVVAKKKKGLKQPENPVAWVAVGLDLSMSSLAGAATAFDKTLKKRVRPVARLILWERGTHYFERMTDIAKAHNFILDLIHDLGVRAELDEIHIAIEEPYPIGMEKRLESNTLKQSAQMSGALMGGLLRYGYTNVYEIQANWWRQIVAKDLGITIHHSKWNPGGKKDITGKFRPKQWVEEIHPKWDGNWIDHITHSKRGRIPRPVGSKAKPVQPDDRYQALAIMEWMRREIKNQRRA